MTHPPTKQQRTALLIHLTVWSLFLLFPLLMVWDSSGTNWNEYLWRLPVICAFMGVFYINYGWLIPRLLFARQHIQRFVVVNAILIVLLCGCNMAAHEIAFRRTPHPAEKTDKQPDMPPPPHLRIATLFFFRDILSLGMTVGLAVAIRMTGQWRKAENLRRELEKSKTEAELQNLKNQLNPHFLLNTLNNIYALIAFDTDKAQDAVQQLSRLLRHLLYEDPATFVPLAREVAFVRSYIELMKIRLTPTVDLRTHIDVPPESATPIAPFLFISLIENAFKHGLSATRTSFIHIDLSEQANGTVHIRIANSHHPKSANDKSGSGIGLGQVSRRLELLYPGRYEWKHGLSDDASTYVSDLRISTFKSIEA